MLQPYEARLIIEYTQLVERHELLGGMLKAWDADKLSFEPDCTKQQLYRQLDAMNYYILALEGRNDFRELVEKGFVHVRK